MSVYDITKPLLFKLSPETAHSLAHRGLGVVEGTPLATLLERAFVVEDERLAVSAFGCDFPNPVGVAAGFDKTAEVPGALRSMGFGHVEVGGVTAQAQAGNARPRVFRLVEDRAIVNRMGLNNPGADDVGPRLAETDVAYPVGVNLGKSEGVPLDEAAKDYRYTYEQVATGGDFFVVNVSCPNSPGFRELQSREPMADIFETLTEAGASPLLVKLSPDLSEGAIEDALELVAEYDLDGVVATNTTTDRPDTLSSPDRVEEGGLSGKPLEGQATELVRFVAERTDVPVVGVGGVFTAADAYRKIRAGASMVQVYTGFVYRGPTIARDINRGLVTLLERDGFDSVEDAVGVDL
ncbi:quinone-dependent dihydroorotate dehydrogenase [Halorhabdus sp. CUG00001]|uniref:quinone-dependent dihydroorotate dehydrogenase n=1 Tax=Halorhabdus sp. CUG00001 TaxID=2600297 RepID=UPI00131D620D|nr:quinone-dependent dihydroorotate dehydrogenase [Halorhabdus sp. CUG00001]